MINILKNINNNIIQYFCDTTFRIIPNKFKNYKLLVILAFDKFEKSTKIGAFVFYNKMNEFTFNKIFSDLKNTFDFNPPIINVDFQKSHINALNKVYNNKIYINTCYFHF